MRAKFFSLAFRPMKKPGKKACSQPVVKQSQDVSETL